MSTIFDFFDRYNPEPTKPKPSRPVLAPYQQRPVQLPPINFDEITNPPAVDEPPVRPNLTAMPSPTFTPPEMQDKQPWNGPTVQGVPQQDRLALKLPPPVAEQPIEATPKLEQERIRLRQLTDRNDPGYIPVVNKEAQTIDPATGKPGKANFWGRLKDAGREALIAAGQQVQANGGVADWGTVGAAAGGGLAGTLDPAMNEKRQRLRDIANTQGVIGDLEQQRASDAKQAQINLENRIKLTDLASKEIKNTKDLREIDGEPYWQYIKNKEEITQKDADFLASIGYPQMDPASWKKYKETTVNGKPYIRAESDKDYQRNTSLPIDPTEVPRDVQIGQGQSLPLTPKQAAPVIAAAENANASRQQGASQFEAVQAGREADKADARREKADNNAAELKGVTAEMESLSTLKGNLQTELATIDPILNESRANQITQQIKEIDSRYSSLKGKEAELKQKQSRPVLNNSKGKGKRTYSDVQIRSIIRQ